MNQPILYQKIRQSLFFALLAYMLAGTPAQSQPRNIQITLPAETLLSTIQQMLPLPLNRKRSDLKGDIMLTTVDTLRIDGSVISLGGTVHGRNLALHTQVGEQTIRLRLGQIEMPLSCTLTTRLDANKRMLFITPNCTSARYRSSKQDTGLDPVLATISNREYALPFDTWNRLSLQLGTQQIHLVLDPVAMVGTDNALLVEMRPGRQKPYDLTK
ncbi:MAG: hypothetical protein CSA33_01140 [Desulfobulbus propionicus]|nr:MAG: hypothetical protein CSA33_01140 [Desulfobulbus propionicus]